MTKNKLVHFEEVKGFPHFFQPDFDELSAGFVYKGHWADFFGNGNPITIEVGCGKAEYSVYLAQRYPERNFVALDIKGARMWRGAKDSQKAGMRNIAFVRSHIQMVPEIFGAGEVAEIWIPFPDPQLQTSRERKRLTSPRMLQRYRQILRPDHLIHFKTDSRPLFDYTLEVIENEGHSLLYHTFDLYQSGFVGDVVAVRTFYERQFLQLGFPINYLEMRLKDE